MREIKFRAWNGTQMLFDDFAVKNGVAVTHEDNGACGDSECCGAAYSWDAEHEDWKLMQFTGFNDKQYAEIYEGDIVKIEYRFRPAEVRWVGAGFYAIADNENDIELNVNRAAQLEVIGNIYENPELLKV